ncbi:MAG: hypothetical protein ABWZ25_19480 [Chitinophagaceae bacterium]
MIKSLGVRRNMPPGIFFAWGKVFFRENNEILEIKDSPDHKIFYQSEEKFVISYSDQRSLVIQTETSIIRFGENQPPIITPCIGLKIIKLVHEKGILVHCKMDNFTDSWEVRNLRHDGTLLWNLKISEPFSLKLAVDGTIVFFMRSKNIYAYRLSDGVELWHIDLKELMPDVFSWDDRQSVIYEGKLFFHAWAQFERGFTFCLDIETGNEIIIINEFHGFFRTLGNQLFTSFEENVVARLNMDAFSVTKWDFSKILKPFDIHMNQFRFFISEDELLFFVDGLAYPNRRFGVINTAKNIVAYIENIDSFINPESFISEINRYVNMVYVHTSDGSLHLYKSTDKMGSGELSNRS